MGGLNSTPIEWVLNPDGTKGYTWNPITGCLNHTPDGLCLGGMFPCYADKIARGRVKSLYLANEDTAPVYANVLLPNLGFVEMNPFYPRFWSKRLYLPFYGEPKGIFVCDMGELFGDWIPIEWQEDIFRIIKLHPDDRFYLLTKQPQNLPKWSPFPDNCWVGATATNPKMAEEAGFWLWEVKAKLKFVSFEPLLERIPVHFADYIFEDVEGIRWIIIGACTGSKTDILRLCNRYPDLTPMSYDKKWTAQPKIEWVEEIVRACDKAGVRVFLKNNLIPALYGLGPFYKPLSLSGEGSWKLRQEVPICGRF